MAGTLFNDKIISAGSLLNTVGTPGSVVQRAINTSFYVVFSVGTSAGVVVIEGAHDPAFAGAGGWALIGTIPWAAADSVKNFNVVGNHRALRARISTAVVGGTVDVYATVTQ